jgi:hypothetical protein
LSAGSAAPVLHDTLAREGLRDIRRLQSAAQLFRAHPGYAADPAQVRQLLGRIDATVFGAGRTPGGDLH